MRQVRSQWSERKGSTTNAGRRALARRPAIVQPETGAYADMWTIAIILIVLWALGLLTSYTMGGLIHILLVVAIVVILIRVIQGRKVV